MSPVKAQTKPAATRTPTRPFTTAVVAHKTRQHYADTLADTLGAHICLDNGRLGCTRNHLQAWKWHAEHTTTEWALVIEDDALPIPEFADQAAAALRAANTPIVSFYLGKQRPPQYQLGIAAAIADAAERDHAYIVADRAYHAVATAIRTNHIRPFLRIATLAHHSGLDIDEMLSEWMRYDGHLVSYTQPSLVDHRDETTIAKHRDQAPRPAGRVAWKVGTRDDWTTGATVIP